MLQGTGSDVGKSLLVAGLARAFTRRGLAVRPFKPQNMSNNAAVTADGGEIGRAQALQARACGVAPTADMNPVLLKPQSESGAQIVRRGPGPWRMPRPREYRAAGAEPAAGGARRFARLGRGGRPRAGRRRRQPGRDQSARRRHRQYGLCRGGRCAGRAGRRHRARRRHRPAGRHPRAAVARASAARLAGYIVNKFRGDVAAVRRRHRRDRRAHRAALRSGSCRGFRARCSGCRPRIRWRCPLRSPGTAGASAAGRSRRRADPHRRAAVAADRQFRRSRPAARRAGGRARHGAGRAGRCRAMRRWSILPGSKATIGRSRLPARARAGTSTSWRITAGAAGCSASAAATRCSAGRIADPARQRRAGRRRRRGSGCSTSTRCSAATSGSPRPPGVELASGVPVRGYEMHLGTTTGPGLARPMLRLGGPARRRGQRRRPGRRLLSARPLRQRPRSAAPFSPGSARTRAAIRYEAPGRGDARRARRPSRSAASTSTALLAAARPPRLSDERPEMQHASQAPAPARPRPGRRACRAAARGAMSAGVRARRAVAEPGIGDDAPRHSGAARRARGRAPRPSPPPASRHWASGACGRRAA